MPHWDASKKLSEYFYLVFYISTAHWYSVSTCYSTNCVKFMLFFLTSYLLLETFITCLPQVPRQKKKTMNIKAIIARCKEAICIVLRTTAHRRHAGRINVISIFIDKPLVFHMSCTKKFQDSNYSSIFYVLGTICGSKISDGKYEPRIIPYFF